MDRNQGGVVTGLGDHGQLSVQVKEEMPRVICAAPPAKHDLRMRGYCQVVLNGMPASTRPDTFGLALSQPKVVLPMTFTDGMSYYTSLRQMLFYRSI